MPLVINSKSYFKFRVIATLDLTTALHSQNDFFVNQNAHNRDFSWNNKTQTIEFSTGVSEIYAIVFAIGRRKPI